MRNFFLGSYPYNELQYRWTSPNRIGFSEKFRPNYKLSYFLSSFNKSSTNGGIINFLTDMFSAFQ